MDWRYALRSFRKNPGFTVLAVLVMALGIGANTAMFSVVNAVLLKPLGYPDPDRIVVLSTLWKKSGGHGQVSAPDYHDWHDQSRAFSAMAYYAGGGTAVTAGQEAEYAQAAIVTPDFFRVFGVEPVQGRLFTPDEKQAGGPAAVLIGHSYWQRRFGGSADVIGKTVRLFGRTLPIVGVMPPGFRFPNETDLWLPANTIFPETPSRSGHNYRVVARLKPDVELEQAQAEMTLIGTRLAQQYPSSNQGKNVAVTRLRDEMVKDVRMTLYMLLGAVGVVLLIACANMANLLLARASESGREIAIRAALGAGRGRIIRQLITESLVLALTAGVAGMLLAVWGSRALVALAPANVPRLAETALDGWVLAFTLGISAAASLLFGLAPALEASRVDLNTALKQGSARATAGGRAGRIRSGLVVAEMALSVVLLCGAGLLLKSFVALHSVALGFRPENLLVMETSVPASNLDEARRATHFYRDLLPGIAAMPGVTAAGATKTLPGRIGSDGSYWIDHLPAPSEIGITAPQAVLSVITPGAFATLGIPLKQGRDFHDGDTYDAPFTAVINEALARKSFAGQDPIGHLVFCGLDSLKPMKIVGVVGDIRQLGPAREPRPEIYMPYQQHPFPSTALNVVVRTSQPPGALADAMRTQVRALSPDVPVKFTTMEATLADNVAAPRFRTLLLGIFAGLAVCLAMAGVYGVMAYVVGQRTGEIGLRMALGARPVEVLRLVLGQGMQLASAGLVLGLLGAVALTRLLTTMLFGVQPNDPLTYSVVTVLLGGVAVAASSLPAWRASRVDPVIALRQE